MIEKIRAGLSGLLVVLVCASIPQPAHAVLMVQVKGQSCSGTWVLSSYSGEWYCAGGTGGGYGEGGGGSVPIDPTNGGGGGGGGGEPNTVIGDENTVGFYHCDNQCNPVGNEIGEPPTAETQYYITVTVNQDVQKWNTGPMGLEGKNVVICNGDCARFD